MQEPEILENSTLYQENKSSRKLASVQDGAKKITKRLVSDVKSISSPGTTPLKSSLDKVKQEHTKLLW